MSHLLIWILIIHMYICMINSNSTELDKCGITNSDRIIGGKNATMGSYPWIARIGYNKIEEKNAETTFRCGGSVITERFVLTASHCVVNLAQNITVSWIRLGEHNTKTNPDCTKSYCNLPYVDYKPEKIISHESYDNPKFQNDIALIKLNKSIRFTDWIKPICLMKGKLLTKNFVGQTVQVAGWGIYDINEPQMSTLLQTVKLSVVDNNRCVTNYKKAAPIGLKQLCVGGKVGEDSCGGDSGGPLMKVDVDGPLGPRYYLIGIVSFGPKLCGESDIPAVYTKISSFIPWILEHTKA